jgi:hypothetical protein
MRIPSLLPSEMPEGFKLSQTLSYGAVVSVVGSSFQGVFVVTYVAPIR